MYKTVVVAGTFDHLHRGHEAVLTRAFAEGERVIIGLTSDEYISKFKVKSEKFKVDNGRKIPNSQFPIRNSKLVIQPFVARKKLLKQWLSLCNFLSRATIVSIDDPYGPALSTKFDALIVTADNKKRGAEINRMRVERGLPQVSLIEVPLVPAEDQKPVSSTRVREGEIDTAGHLVLPDSLRPELAQPLGLVLTTPGMIARSIVSHKENIIITVGDLTTKTFLDAGVVPTLSIIDGRLMRNPYEDAKDALARKNVKVVKVKSGPGFISKEAIKSLQRLLQGSTLQRASRHSGLDPESSLDPGSGAGMTSVVLLIEGEEDLLTLPAVMYAPVGAVVYYGQPPIAEWACGPLLEGMVEVAVTKEKQKEVAVLLGQFKSNL